MSNKIGVKKNKDFFKFLIDLSRKKSVNPLFNNIKVVFDNSSTTWFSTDGEISYFFIEEVDNEILGSCVFNGNIFWNFLKKVKSEFIEVEWNKSFLNLVDNNNKASLKLCSQELVCKDMSNITFLCSLPSKDIKSVIDGALLPVDDVTGGLLSLIIKQNKLNFLARDNRRLSFSEIEEYDLGVGTGLTITARPIVMDKLLDFCDKYDAIDIYHNDNEYMIKQNNEYLIFKMLNAGDINYESLCSNLNFLEYKCDAKELSNAVDFVNIMCSKLNHTVELIFNGNELDVRVTDPNQGKCIRNLTGEGEIYGKIYLNIQYLIDVLSLKKDADIFMYYKSQESRFVLKNGIATHVIMPVIR